MAEPRHFLCRLIPPRPDFAATMTAEERSVMQNHAAYWIQNLERGRAIVFGPVADPKGDWGVGIVDAADLAAVEALRDADPAILSGRGFRYEILPMPRLITAPRK
jgi:uncharacterized protein YciI